ncbi:MAG: hypothetical protein AAF171_10775 [Cyanobacteria bacterium P01_A01_bin.116]
MALSFNSLKERTASTGNLPFSIVFWIALYTPFEEFILRWLPSSVGVLLRFVPELILYGLVAQVCGSKLLRREPLKKTPIDLLVLIFFVATAISIVINDSSLKGSLINLRTIWRYLSVFYLVVNIDISRDDLKKLLNGLKIVMVVQGIIGSLQYFLPASFNQAFFAPRSFEIGSYKASSNAAEAGGLKVGATAGTFSDPAILSAFLLIGLILFFASTHAQNAHLLPSLSELRNMGVLLFGLFATKKRAALVLGILIPIVTLYVYRKGRKLLHIGWFYGALALISVLAITAISSGGSSFAGVDEREQSVELSTYFLQLFSSDYWAHSSETARGWFMTTIVHAIFSTHSWFGFGPDAWHTLQAIEDTLTSGTDIDKLKRDADVFDDGFWFAFMAYFGIVGTAVYGFILKRLYDAGRWLARVATEPEYKALGATFGTLVIITVLYTFAERIFRLRAFSFYFWLLAGLVVNVCHVKMAAIREERRLRLENDLPYWPPESK